MIYYYYYYYFCYDSYLLDIHLHRYATSALTNIKAAPTAVSG